MDSLKACVNPTDECGFLTAGEIRTLELTIEKSGEPVDLTGATFVTMIPAYYGGTAVLPTGSHTIQGAPTLGRVDLALAAADSAKIKRGQKVPFMVNVTIGLVTQAYWGHLDEVREPVK
jgi:hypothetical protein